MQKLANIWASFCRIKLATQLWMMCVLGPVALAPLFALDGPLGPWLAILSVLGVLPGLVFVWREEGFSRRMAFGHLVFWPVAVVLVVVHFVAQGFDGSGAHWVYAINAIVLSISIGFDVREVQQLRSGATEVA